MKKIVFNTILNNFIANFFIRLFGFERVVYYRSNPYLNFLPNQSKSLQENAGYSNRPEINEVIEKSKVDLRSAINDYCVKGNLILDVGCGPGMYLQCMDVNLYKVYATDLNLAMLAEAKRNVPNVTFVHGNFINLNLHIKFNFIYCIGVLVYIPKSSIEIFLKKVNDSLLPKGIFYLNYPHAISWKDTLYHDLTYIHYSPEAIENFIKPYFNIIKHEHAFDGRKVGAYDKQPYKSLNPNTNRTYKNSYLLVAQKKDI